MIIEIEGIDGVGKTTQCRLLKNWLESQRERSVIVKDLDSTRLGRQLKSFLTAEAVCSKEVELFAFLCCKAHMFSTVVRREVNKGSHIICDRGTGSFLSYFEVSGFSSDFLKEALSVALPRPYGPVTILIDADVQKALRQNMSKPNYSKFDNAGSAFFEKQRLSYQYLARAGQWYVIDGNGSVEDVYESMIDIVRRLIHLK